MPDLHTYVGPLRCLPAPLPAKMPCTYCLCTPPLLLSFLLLEIAQCRVLQEPLEITTRMWGQWKRGGLEKLVIG